MPLSTVDSCDTSVALLPRVDEVSLIGLEVVFRRDLRFTVEPFALAF
jgi:hypothetical protein